MAQRRDVETSMSRQLYPGPSPYLEANEFTDEFNAAALLSANLAKMHHQQSISHNIRIWSFALTGFFLGSNFLYNPKWKVAITALAIAETILVLILFREIDWQRMFWRYRDRVRTCEAYLVGCITRDQCRREYLQAKDRSRSDLAKVAFDPVRLLTNSTDFIEVYLMIALLAAFAARLL
jgi:hypothetical protein